MTHEPAGDRTTLTAASLPAAVEGLLSRVLLQEAPNAGEMKHFIVGYGVEADDMASLIVHTIEEIEALVSEQNAAIVACDVSGLRPAGERSRLWGTIECVPSSGAAQEASRVDDIAYKQFASDQWQVSARIINSKNNKERS